MTTKKLIRAIEDAATFAEADSDLEEGKIGDSVFAGASWLKRNAKLAASAPKLVEALGALMRDYQTDYLESTDGQYGKEPGSQAWRTAKRLLKDLGAPFDAQESK